MDGLAVAVGHAHGDHRARNAVCDQHRFFADQRRGHGVRGIVNGALEPLDDHVVGIAHFGHESRVALAKIK